jgi:hypothetical protein
LSLWLSNLILLLPICYHPRALASGFLGRTGNSVHRVWTARDVPTVPSSMADQHSHLASAYALRGEPERAAAELAEARRLAGERPFSSIARLKATSHVWEVPQVQTLAEATYFAGLRKAGMPEE